MTRPARFLVRVGAMASKEVMHIRRDPRTLYMALAMPVVMLLISASASASTWTTFPGGA